MKASVIGRVQNTELSPKRALHPLFEAVSNSIHAVAGVESETEPLIEIKATRTDSLFENAGQFESFEIIDNGIGFNHENFESFNTVDTLHKASLGAKGLGRFIWLKAFEKVEIESHFKVNNTINCRSFTFTLDDEDIKESSIESAQTKTQTTVKLVDFKPKYANACTKDLKKIAEGLIEHFFLLFLDEGCPKIILTDGNIKIHVNETFNENYDTQATESEFSIQDYKFNVRGFKLFNSKQTTHSVQYLAHNRCVERERLDKIVNGMSKKFHDEEHGDFIYLALVEGKFFDESVNNERTDFNIAKNDPDLSENSDELGTLLKDEITFPQIKKLVGQEVSEQLKPFLEEIRSSKEEIIDNYIVDKAPQYRLLRRYMDEIVDNVSSTPDHQEIEATLQNISHRKRQEARSEAREILSGSTQDFEEYKTRFASFLERFSELCTTPLAEYIIHRKIILELFEKALQVNSEDNEYSLESAIHNIIYPMRTTSNEISYEQQNLWIIDERLTYHSFLASDKSLKSMDGLESESGKRPDIIIFNNKLAYSESKDPLTSVVIIEFKRPGISSFGTKTPIRQVFDMIGEIRDGKIKDSNGRPLITIKETTQFYVYVICDMNEELEDEINFIQGKPTPDNLGYFGYNDHTNAYYEVISYSKLLKDSQKRNRVLFDKLGIPADIS